MEENSVLRYDPSVFVVGHDYQIIFLTTTMGLGWIEIDGERFTDEECGLLMYDTVHKIPVPGEKLNKAGHYTVVFVEYADKKPYFPEGIEKVRKTYNFYPLQGENFRLFQFADTHARTVTPVETYRAVGDCDIILLNGDINEWSDKVEHFYTSFELSANTAHGERPVIYSRGNHDTRGHAAQLLPNYIPTAFRDGRRETFYSFRQDSLWGLVLDCGEDKYDQNVEYGGTVLFENFRKRETAYLESLIANKENEYAAEGVKYKIAFCHVPITEKFEYPFDVASDIYEYWIKLLDEMGIDLLLCGHMHRAYLIPPHTEGKGNADFMTAVLSIPAKKREDGSEYYVGGILSAKEGTLVVNTAPYGENLTLEV